MKLQLLASFTACALIQVFAQTSGKTPLQQVFEDLHSSDEGVRSSANARSLAVLEKEYPVIERDAGTLCAALGDRDDYVRLQAAGILAVVAQFLPEHKVVVEQCAAPLIKAGSDSAPRVRQDAIIAMAMVPGGPPVGAVAILRKAATESDTTTQRMAIIGLTKLSATNGDAESAVLTTLKAASTADSKVVVLQGIAMARVSNAAIAQAVRGSLDDRSPNVQNVAVVAFESASPDKTSAALTLQNFAGSASSSIIARQTAEQSISRLQSASRKLPR